ncbi:winged helix-turn-helix domain-containing protein [Demequina sediminicola]|uniref:winged helix-turn-helix domain-containing protein n=1 Tax=Demequina sediminicola TaxID=1095026 RepID=UPI0007809321|nr:winged helix-turn-helix domain-containing protein [Demequina sediminicola]
MSTERHLDSSAIKGLAHPLRVAIIDELQSGPATASVLAEALGESTGSTSYHLRQLSRHGFIEDDPGHLSGRERWWRLVPGSMRVDVESMRDEPITSAPAVMVSRQFIAQRAARIDDFLAHGAQVLDAEWHEAATLTGTTASLTLQETRDLADLLERTMREFMEPLTGREAPEGARRVAAHANVFPLIGRTDTAAQPQGSPGTSDV